MLEIRDLHASVEDKPILKGINLKIESGEIHAVMGPNGSGKSTLFNCINGFHQPQKGKIQYRGQSLTKCQPHEVVKLGISRTFQNLQNVPYMTVLNNILIGAHQRITLKETLYRWLTTAQREREEAMALKVMDFLGITNFEQKYLSGQPYGIQKLVEIGRALISQPHLILMDEPAAGMNDQETIEIAKIIGEIRDRLGITVLVVEHDMNLVMKISDRVCVLDSGHVLALGTPEEVKQHPEVIKVFLGEQAHA